MDEIDKEEFKKLVHQKIDNAEDEAAKVQMKEHLDKLLEHKLY